jgi:hypothetical protein
VGAGDLVLQDCRFSGFHLNSGADMINIADASAVVQVDSVAFVGNSVESTYCNLNYTK